MSRNPDIDRYNSRRSVVYASNGLVATSQPLAAECGLQALRAGGNAFDAAVTTAATLNVVEATSTGLGGDVFAIYRTADGEVGAMQSCGGAPAEATLERVRDAVAREQDADPESVSMPQTGPHTVTVPGTALGWETIVDRFGERSLADALAPAVEYATEGFPVSEVVAEDWKRGDDLFADARAREAYLKDDRPPRAGETMTLPDLGESLRRVGAEGANVVYEGDVGDAIVETVREKGGFLSKRDLEAFEPSSVDPIHTTYNGATVYELPPNNQGMIALEALNIAEALGAGDHGFQSVERVHRLVEAMKRAFEDGHHYVTDPMYEDVPVLNSKAYARRRASEVGQMASQVTYEGPGSDTVLLTVADGAGNLVSFINSRFAGFGSGLVAEGTGIALQNRGASFSLDPSTPNRLEPGKRPFHTLIPGLVEFGSDDWAAFGVMGGPMQPQGHLQVLSHVIDYDLPLQAALDEPRWQYLESGDLAVEARFDDVVQSSLARRGHELRVLAPQWFGGGQIVRNDGGTLSGATDPRKDGTVVGF